ncbi:mitotic checkpoint protein prcc-carboxy-term protein [Ceratobasidium sp. AG-Ba]|nr:mitotic checkpoint protein prcc-carboxy-term protein [Ceratobasidium sp. AG-Ba]
MLGGLATYGSDSESDGESNSPPPKTVDLPASKPAASQNSAAKSTETKPSNGLALPPPKKRRDGPVRITVEAPKFEDEDEDSERAPKKPRTVSSLGGKGAGSSLLFSALPAPKNAVPIAPEPTRVLGGGGGPALSFASAPTNSRPSVSEEKGTSNGLFLPPTMAKGKAKEPKEALPTVAAAPVVDFFSLGMFE